MIILIRLPAIRIIGFFNMPTLPFLQVVSQSMGKMVQAS
jgi:hypothetical protein